MGQNKTLKHDCIVRLRFVPVLLAAGVGYVFGSFNIAAPRTIADVSANNAISLRFPSDWNNLTPKAAIAALPAAIKARAQASDPQLALLSPEPMVPPVVVTQSVTNVAQGSSIPSAVLQTASIEQSSAVSPIPNVTATPAEVAVRAPRAVTPPPPAPHRAVANRPGYMLDEAQIASIKERLHLTPDQEQMWPAVEAALRNMRYTHVLEAHAHGAVASSQQAAVVDPNSVQGLKSAAVPLIMSFNADQKEEVRNVAHVMGLDQLAQQF